MENANENENGTWSEEDERVFFHRLIGFEVLDRDGNRVGVVDAVFEDEPDRREFLGMRLGTLGLGRLRLVPAQFAEIDENTRKIKFPFPAHMLERAPAFDGDFEFGSESERKVYDYYRQAGFPFEEYGIHERL
ncbi:MAG TPA: PRC-barrel domain-containing protein [Fibrobacteria bacterium]|nr:PRC-barrel domain-containing protein [Fibrobacteria bacterium]